MNTEKFVEGILTVMDEASKTPDEYINPNLVCEILEVIDAYYGVPEDSDHLWDYMKSLYEL